MSVDWGRMKYWRESLAVAQRILLELLRRQRSLISWSIFPISILLLNGFILAEGTQQPVTESFNQAAPATLVGVGLFFSCMGGTVATIIAERERHTFKRLVLSPLSGISYFLGIFLAFGCVGLGQTLLVYLVAAWFGAEFSGSLLLGGMILLLSIAAYVGVGFLVAAQFGRRIEDVNSLVAAFGVPLLMLGGAFFPTSYLPEALLQLAQLNPIYHMNQAFVAVSAEGESLNEIAENFQFLSGFVMLAIAAAWLSYRRILGAERSL